MTVSDLLEQPCKSDNAIKLVTSCQQQLFQTCYNNWEHIISTDEDPGLRIESFAVINLRGVSTNKTIIRFIAMQTYTKNLTGNKQFEHNLSPV
jgi:hypothetical protein